MPARPPPAPPAPRRGRRRSDASRRAILAAALALARERPLAEVSVEAIASAAGVGKQTIYRWWSGKAAVLLDALGEFAEAEIPERDLGGLEADLAALLARSFAAGRRARVWPVLRGLMAEAQADAALAEALRARFVERRRDAVRRLLARAAGRGEVDGAADREVLVDLVFGGLWYRLLVGHAPLDEPFARALARAVARAAAPAPHPAGRGAGRQGGARKAPRLD